jgi:hypothetical protein
VAIDKINSDDAKAPFKEWTKSSADLLQGHWGEDVKKQPHEWSAENKDKARAAG